jgi:hypothetical protein
MLMFSNRPNISFLLTRGLCIAGVALLCAACADQATQPQAAQTEPASSPAPAASAVTASTLPTFRVEIPDAGNAAANRVPIRSLRLGVVDGPTQKILTLLRKPTTQPFELVIEGRNGTVNVATLDRALHNLKAPVTAPHRIVIQALPTQIESLQSLAAEKGVTVVAQQDSAK